MQNPLYVYKTGKGQLILSTKLPIVSKDNTLEVSDCQSQTSFSHNIDFTAAALMSGLHIMSKDMSEDDKMKLLSELDEILRTSAVIVGATNFKIDRVTIDDIKSLQSS